MSNNIILFKGIKFYNFSSSYLIKKITKEGGYLVAPAASALSTILKNNAYYRSLKESNIAILDSGFFCILLRIFLSPGPRVLFYSVKIHRFKSIFEGIFQPT